MNGVPSINLLEPTIDYLGQWFQDIPPTGVSLAAPEDMEGDTIVMRLATGGFPFFLDEETHNKLPVNLPCRAKYGYSTYYIRCNPEPSRSVLLHNLIKPKIHLTQVCDHIDGRGYNDCLNNLRQVTLKENALNTHDCEWVGVRHYQEHWELFNLEYGLWMKGQSNNAISCALQFDFLLSHLGYFGINFPHMFPPSQKQVKPIYLGRRRLDEPSLN